jgi:hypothetical protein
MPLGRLRTHHTSGCLWPNQPTNSKKERKKGASSSSVVGLAVVASGQTIADELQKRKEKRRYHSSSVVGIAVVAAAVASVGLDE